MINLIICSLRQAAGDSHQETKDRTVEGSTRQQSCLSPVSFVWLNDKEAESLWTKNFPFPFFHFSSSFDLTTVKIIKNVALRHRHGRKDGALKMQQTW